MPTSRITPPLWAKSPAQRSAHEQLAGAGELGEEAHHVRDEQPHPRRLAGVDHRLGVLQAARDRLLADYVLARARRRDCGRGVVGGGRADVDDVAGGQQGVDRRERLAAVLRGRRLRPRPVGVVEARQLNGQGAPVGGVPASHAAAADYSDAFHRSSSRPGGAPRG
jgi:hypothetical protein